MRVYNFSAGPSMLPVEVLEEAGRQITDYEGCGMSVMELSHRGKVYEPIHDECISLVRELMNISDEYEVLLLQGGASTQFEAVPLNLLKKGRADYVVTGNFSKKAYKEAIKYGDIRLVASSEEAGYTYIPKVTRKDFRDDIDYVHITENNTIFGTKWHYLPDCGAPLVSDMSSCIMSEVADVNKYALIYAGAQKNLAPAGVTLVIVRKDMLGGEMAVCPTMLKYSVHAANNSLYNTPPCWAIYVMMLNMRYLKKMGGVPAMEKINREKSAMLYDQGEPRGSLHDERPLRHSLRGAGRQVRQRGGRRGTRVPQGSPSCGRNARIHLQRNARRRREGAHRLHEEVRARKQVRAIWTS